MPTVVRSRTVPARPEEVWDVISDPYHLPRWWPRVERVEEVTPTAWTNVLRSPRGRIVRADFTRTASVRPRHLAWRQEVEASPFERVFAEISTEISIEPEGGGEARVELKAIHRLRGRSRFGAFMARRAARRALDQALDGLGRAFGGEG
ncbi:MAG: SRPBCC family protein [Actinobacteria bacterium]|nr:SRPBCC family protein [Actinomycetota bacterium]